MVIYHLARLDNWTGKYRFHGFAMDRNQMKTRAQEIFQRTAYNSVEWLVFGSTSIERLSWMLKQKNSRKPSCCSTLRTFLTNGMNEDRVRTIEAKLWPYDAADGGSGTISGTDPLSSFTEFLEREGDEGIKVRRRLEFARWLLKHGKISE